MHGTCNTKIANAQQARNIYKFNSLKIAPMECQNK